MDVGVTPSKLNSKLAYFINEPSSNYADGIHQAAVIIFGLDLTIVKHPQNVRMKMPEKLILELQKIPEWCSVFPKITAPATPLLPIYVALAFSHFQLLILSTHSDGHDYATCKKGKK